MANTKIKLAIFIINIGIKFIPSELRTKALINNMIISGTLNIKE